MNNLQKAFSVYEGWMDKAGKSPAYIQSCHYAFKAFMERGFSCVCDEQVESFLEYYPNVQTKNKRLAELRAFHTWVSRTGQFKDTVGPFTLQHRKYDLGVPKTLQKRQQARLLEHLKQINLSAWAHARIMIATGMRAGEVCMLTKDHIKDINGVTCAQFTNKGKERIVALGQEALSALEIWLSCPISRDWLGKCYRRAKAEAGLENFVPHWFRHGFSTAARAAGHSYEDIADVLGNSVEVTRQRYARIDIERMKRLME